MQSLCNVMAQIYFKYFSGLSYLPIVCHLSTIVMHMFYILLQVHYCL